MYAIVQKGTKQFEIEKGKIYQFDKMRVETGDEVVFDEVLLIADGKKATIGQPVVEGAKVTGDVIGSAKGKKVISFKYKRRKSSEKKIGHRQKYTLVKIKEIAG